MEQTGIKPPYAKAAEVEQEVNADAHLGIGQPPPASQAGDQLSAKAQMQRFRLRTLNLALSGCICALASTAGAAPGPVATNIVPGAGAGNGVGTTVTNTGTLYVIDGGTLKGGNLFESFSTFDLAAGNTSAWTFTTGNAASVTNVINRVTGGSLSNVYGTIDTTALPNAAFYFINPAGIVFGLGASLNIPRATHFSTARQLVFSDRAIFSASTPSGSTLTMANPVAFGFLGGEGDIIIDRASPSFTNGNSSLSFFAPNISITNSSFQAGQLDLIAVGSQQISLPMTNPLSVNGLSGTLTIDGSSLTTVPATVTVGSINLGGGQINVINAAAVQALASNTASGGDVVITAQELVVDGGASVAASTGTVQPAGNVTVNAGSVLIGGSIGAAGSYIFSGTDGSGNAGQIAVTVSGSLTVQGGGIIGSAATGSGNAGAVAIEAQNLVLQSGGGITSSTVGSGNAGPITIDAGSALIDGGASGLAFVQSSSGVDAAGQAGTGNAGSIAFNVAGNLRMKGGASISSTATGITGTGGDIMISSGSLTIDGTGITLSPTSINTGSASTGDAGRISVIAAGDVTIENGAFIASDTEGKGNGGDVSITANSLNVKNASKINANTGSAGNAGTIFVNANSVLIDGAAAGAGQTAISSDTGGSGNGGQVSVNASGNLTVQNGGYISANTYSLGNAGSVSVTAGSLLIDGGASRAASGIVSASTVDSVGNVGTGNAGRVTVTVAGNLTMQDSAFISTDADDSSGLAGKVAVSAASLVMDGDGINPGSTRISSDTASSGDAGQVSVEVTGNLTVENGGNIGSDTFGSGNANDVNVAAGSLLIDGGASGVGTGITSASTANLFGNVGTGNAGRVTVTVPGSLTIQNGGGIFTDADEGASVAGEVNVTAGSLQIDGGGTVGAGTTGISSDTYGAGSAGQVLVNVPGNLAIQNGGYISSNTFGTGNAGQVNVTAASLSIYGGPSGNGYTGISSDSTDDGYGDVGTGNAGHVTVTVPGTLTLADGGFISSVAYDAKGAAGDVTVNAGSLLIKGGVDGASSTEISTSTLSSGNAGVVAVNVSGMMTVEDGGVVLSSTYGSGNAGNITINASSLLLDGGAAKYANITSNSASDIGGGIGSGNAGKVTVSVTGGLSLINGGEITSSALDSVGNGGDVHVSAASLAIDTGSGLQGGTGIAAVALGSGNAGQVFVDVTGSLSVAQEGLIETSTFGSGNAGSVSVTAGAINLSGGSAIASSSNTDAGGASGTVTIHTGSLNLGSGALVETNSPNAYKAGDILINAPNVLVDGLNTHIASVNSGLEGGSAGQITINTHGITVSNGGAVTTNAATGPAGNISLNFPNAGLLVLDGKASPGLITTSSGSNTGGRILIANPYAIILNGGTIEALGPAYRAFVTIKADQFIKSSDRPNLLAVQGQLVLDSQIEDVSKGADEIKVSYADAFGVLISHCAATRSNGQVSALTIGQIKGPYEPALSTSQCN